MLTVQAAKPNFQLLYFGFKTTRPMVADHAGARGHEHRHRPRRDRQGILLGNADPASTIVDAGGARSRPEDGRHRPAGPSSGPRSCSTRPAGSPAPTASARRTASSSRPRSTTPANANSARVAEAIQGYLRKIGVHWQLQPWDSTIASVKMAEQDYEIWSVTVPTCRPAT
jgi:peptide/nickel transport system substrate-binding protein